MNVRFGHGNLVAKGWKRPACCRREVLGAGPSSAYPRELQAWPDSPIQEPS